MYYSHKEIIKLVEWKKLTLPSKTELCFLHRDRTPRGQEKWSNQYMEENCVRERAWASTVPYKSVIMWVAVSSYFLIRISTSRIAMRPVFWKSRLVLSAAYMFKNNSYHFCTYNTSSFFFLTLIQISSQRLLGGTFFFFCNLWVDFSEHIKPQLSPPVESTVC